MTHEAGLCSGICVGLDPARQGLAELALTRPLARESSLIETMDGCGSRIEARRDGRDLKVERLTELESASRAAVYRDNPERDHVIESGHRPVGFDVYAEPGGTGLSPAHVLSFLVRSLRLTSLEYD
jgi:hypothetical protein